MWFWWAVVKLKWFLSCLESYLFTDSFDMYGESKIDVDPPPSIVFLFINSLVILGISNLNKELLILNI